MDFPGIVDSVILLRFEYRPTINPKKFMKILEAVFQKTKIFNFFLKKTTLNLEGRSKKKETGNICKGTPDI